MAFQIMGLTVLLGGATAILAISVFCKKILDWIDKTIDHLQKVKKELQGSDNQLRIANGKVEDVSIKKLMRNNPTMQSMFAEQQEN